MMNLFERSKKYNPLYDHETERAVFNQKIKERTIGKYWIGSAICDNCNVEAMSAGLNHDPNGFALTDEYIELMYAPFGMTVTDHLKDKECLWCHCKNTLRILIFNKST